MIKDATKDWPAVTKWSTEYLVDVSRGVEFRATSGAAPLPATFTMERYARYCGEGVGRTSNGVGGGGGNRTEEAPLYLFDRNFRTNCPQLVEDYRDALRESCPYFDVGAEHGHDLFSLLGEEKRPDYCWIIAGPKRYVCIVVVGVGGDYLYLILLVPYDIYICNSSISSVIELLYPIAGVNICYYKKRSWYCFITKRVCGTAFWNVEL